jgi:hypothetical protein
MKKRGKLCQEGHRFIKKRGEMTMGTTAPVKNVKISYRPPSETVYPSTTKK